MPAKLTCANNGIFAQKIARTDKSWNASFGLKKWKRLSIADYFRTARADAVTEISRPLTGERCYNMRFSRDAGPVRGVEMSTPLTVLSEDEQLFRDSCRSFAEDRINPL